MPTAGVLIEREATGKLQDLAEAFVNAEKRSLPFTSAIPKGAAPVNAQLEYPVEKYDSPDISGALDEADPPVYENPRANDGLLMARLQTKERAARVGGDALTFMHLAHDVTPKTVLAKAIAKELVQLKTDWETIMLGDGECQIAAGNLPNLTRGLGKWISSTAQAVYPVPAPYLTPSASIDSSTTTANYNDTTITAVAESMFQQHGDDTSDIDVWCGSTWKRKAIGRITYYENVDNGLTSVRRFNQEPDDPVVLGKVDVLRTDFGLFKLRLSRWINTGGDPTSAASKLLAYACPMEKLELRMAETPYMLPLARTGRNQKFLVTATGALCCLNPLPFGKWAPAS